MSKKDKLLKQVKSSVDANQLALDSSIKETGTSRAEVEGTKRLRNARLINITRIKPDPDQPRKTFDQESLNELADSIREHGILQPITVEFVETDEGGYFKIISGERRYQASKIVGLKEMPCITFSDVSANDRYARQLIENIQREDLSPIEKAVALISYKDRLGKNAVWSDVEKVVGISDRRRKQFIALLNLPENIQKEIVAIGKRPAKNQVTEKHARALLLLNDQPEKQLDLFQSIKSKKTPITGDDAIAMAREAKGKSIYHSFTVKYLTEKELLEILEKKIKKLKDELGI
jgi:ParB family transcriptional regulator, chromosome partitioning protein